MQEAEYKSLLEKSLRGPLSAAEQTRLEAFLAARPDLQEAWQEEAALSRLIRQLPAAPLASNFTAQVLQAVEREARPAVRPAAGPGVLGWLRRHWMPVSLGTALLVFGFSVVSHRQTQARHRATLAAQVAIASAVPSVDALKDYEAIRRLSQVSTEPDLDLLAALQ